MRCLPILILIVIQLQILAGCRSESAVPSLRFMTLTSASTQLAKLAGKPVRPYATRDFGREQYRDARSVVVPKLKAESIVQQLRPSLGPGLLTFVGCTRSLDSTSEPGSEVVIAEGATQFDILEIAKSDAVNFDMDTKDLIHKLKQYDAMYGIDIFHAETDTIEFTLRTLPKDMKSFCEDLYKFCPDIVDQGAGTLNDLEKQITESKSVYLWWD